MKTAIKRFLEDWDSLPPNSPYVRKRAKELRKAMEEWCNA